MTETEADKIVSGCRRKIGYTPPSPADDAVAEARRRVARAEQRPKRATGEGVRAGGHFAVFFDPRDTDGTEARIHIGHGLAFRERLAPTAFDAALGRPDPVYLALNHRDEALATTTAKTLAIWKDAKGLAFDAVINPVGLGEFVAESMRRGDLAECSISFNVDEEVWTEERGEEVRTIESMTLYEGTICFRGAYSGTSSHLNSDRSRTMKPARQSSRKLPRSPEQELREARARLARRFNRWSNALNSPSAHGNEDALSQEYVKLDSTNRALNRLAVKLGLEENPDETITVRFQRCGTYTKIRRKDFVPGYHVHII